MTNIAENKIPNDQSSTPAHPPKLDYLFLERLAKKVMEKGDGKMKNSDLLKSKKKNRKKFISAILILAFTVTGFEHGVTWLQIKSAFASSTSPSSTAGGFSNLQDSAGLNQSFHTDLFTGRAQTSIPIFTPPGRRGLTPQVGLSYSSSGSNSWLGTGWGLDTGFIQRSTKKGAPSYNDSQDIFTFMIQGVNSELIKTTGNEYRAKDESGEFLKFMFQDGYWMVYDKSGTQYTFGQNIGARQNNPRGIFGWYLEKVKDVYGNTIQYTYQKPSSTEMYLSRVDYNGNETENFQSTHSIDFILETANRPDLTFSYMTGARVDEKRRLQRIEVKVQGQLSRKYNFTYEQSPIVGRSRLKTVQECGTDGSTCLPTQTFTYQDYQLAIESTPQTTLIQNGNGTSSTFNSLRYVYVNALTYASVIDLNGDGLLDRVLTPVGAPYNHYRIQFQAPDGTFSAFQNWPVYSSQGDSGDGSIEYTNPSYGATQLDTMDLNGDGWPDRIFVSPNGIDWRIQWNNQGAGYSAPVTWQVENQLPGYWYHGVIRATDSAGQTYLDLFDINGDGIPDRVGNPTGANNTLKVQPGTGSGFGPVQTWTVQHPDSINPYWRWVRWTDTYTTKLDTIDMNGDGLPDRIYSDFDPAYNIWKISFNNGSGFEPPVTWAIENGNGSAREWGVIREGLNYMRQDLIDVNGDGLPDRVMSKASAPYDFLKVQFNTGSGFLPSVQWNIFNQNPSDQSQGVIHYSEGNGAYLRVATLDINSDGLPDRLKVQIDGSNNTWKASRQTGEFPDLLKSINNGRGGVTTFEYKPSTQFDNRDLQGIHRLPFPVHVVTKVTNSDGLGNSYETNISYKGGMFDANSREFRGFREVTVTDARGTQSITTFLQDGHRRGRPAQVEVKDAQGNLFTKTVNDWGNCADDTYPGVHFVKLRQIDSYLYDGDVTFKHTRKRFQYDGTNGNLLTTFDDGDPNITTDDRRQTTEYVLNPASYILNTVSKTSVFDHQNTLINEKYFYYDNATDINTAPVKGALTKQEDLLTAGSLQPATKIAYDSFGNIQSVTDAMNKTTVNEYDPTFKLYLTKVTNTLGHTQEFTYDPLIAQITQTKDQNNQISRTVYDKLGRAIKVISPLDSEASPTQFVLYDDTIVPNRVITKVKVDTNAGSVTNDDQPQAGYLTTYTFTDGLGRTIQKRSPSETSGTQIVSGVVKFNARGQLSEQYAPYFADFKTTYGTLMPNPSQDQFPHVLFHYDQIGRRIKIAYPDGTFATVQYDDYVKTMTDPNGHQKRYTQDTFGNLVKVEEFNLGQTYTTYYEYDPLNRLVKTTDHLGNVTEVEYDLLGRKTLMSDPNMGIWSYTYDDNNNLLTQTDAKNQTISFQYDSLNRLTKKTYPNNAHIDYVYDSCPSDTCGGITGTHYPIGKLLKVTDNSGVQTFRYDALGRVIQDKKDLDDGESYMFTRIYDPQGRVTSLEYPDGDILNLTFNNMGEAETLTLIPQGSASKTIIANVNYNPSGQITKIEYGNGVTSDYTYNPQTLRLENLLTKNAQNVSLQNLTYAFDNAGNVQSITDAINTNTQSFEYDDLDRLTQATGSYGAHTFEYNPIGNMTRKNNAILNYSDPNHPHAVTRYQVGSEVINYQYDANGNMTNRGNDTISYDFDNRPIRMDRTTTSGGCQIYPVPVDYYQVTSAPDTSSMLQASSSKFQAPSLEPEAGSLKREEAVIANHVQNSGEAIYDPQPEAGSLQQDNRPNTIIQPCPSPPQTTTHTFAQYVYDASGQRVKKITDDKIQYYLGKDYEVEYTTSGSLTRKAFFLGDTRIAEYEIPESALSTPHLRFFHGDHLGSTNIVTNEQGHQTLLMEYLPYGEVKLRVGSDPVQNTFTGQKEDLESGLMYYNARFYDPKLGRFIQADSIVPNATDPQEFNRYSYVNNNPIKFTDPTGHKKKKWWKTLLKVAAVVAIVVAAIFIGAIVGTLIHASFVGLGPALGGSGTIIGGIAGGAAGGVAASAATGGSPGAGAAGGALSGFTAGFSSAFSAGFAGVNSGLATGQVTKANEFVKVGAQMLGDFGVTQQVLGQIGGIISKTVPGLGEVLSRRSGFGDSFWQGLYNFSYDRGLITAAFDFRTGIPSFVRSVTRPDAKFSDMLFSIGRLEFDLLGGKMITAAAGALRVSGAIKAADSFEKYGKFSYNYGYQGKGAYDAIKYSLTGED